MRTNISPFSLLYFLSICVLSSFASEQKCLEFCICNDEEKTVICSGSRITELPQNVPSGFEVLYIRNATMRSLPKHSFRRMDRLREIHFEHCDQLECIEKFAFKGLKHLRLISITHAPRLFELTKGAFSGIGNDFGVKIRIHAPIHTVHSGVFRHSHNLREVHIVGYDMTIQRHAFSAITQLDFLTLSGVSRLESCLFTNSTRFHMVHIKDSHFEIPMNAFSDLAHVHQVIIQRSKIPYISTDAFTGMSTVETVELFDNSIGTISAHSFSGIVNMGRLRIARNSIRNMDSPESILSQAIQLRFEENTVACSCDIKWMGAHNDRSVGDSNYCGTVGVHRTIRHYIRLACSGTRSARPYTENALQTTYGMRQTTATYSGSAVPLSKTSQTAVIWSYLSIIVTLLIILMQIRL